MLQAVHGAATAFFNPAATGLTPMTVSPERLQQANGLRAIAMAGSGIAGPAIAGALVAGVGSGWAIAADAGSFALSAAFLTGLRLPAHVRLPAQSFVRDLLDGWREFSSRTWVWVVVVCAALGNGANAPFSVLGPAISRRSLGGAGAWALIVAAFSAGSVAGGLASLRLKPRRPLLVAGIALVPFALPTLLLAVGTPALVIAAAALVAGAGGMLANTVWETTLQQRVPRAALSRVSAYDWFGSLVVQPLGFALVGPAVTLAGTHVTLYGGATIMFAACLGILAVPSVRKLETRPVTPQEPMLAPLHER